MDKPASVLTDGPDATAYISSDDRFVLLFADEADITPMLDQAAALGYVQLIRQWEDFTLARTGMEFTR